MDPQELLLTLARAVGVYLLMLVVIRLLGKRTIGNFSAFDLLVALMLGEVVDEIIYGDVGIAQGAVAIVAIAALKYATGWLSYSSEAAARLLEGAPTPVVVSGEFQRSGMRQELMNESDIRAALRLQSVDDPSEVKLAQVETDGEVSVMRAFCFGMRLRRRADVLTLRLERGAAYGGKAELASAALPMLAAPRHCRFQYGRQTAKRGPMDDGDLRPNLPTD
jgi:hypothetical protein